MSPVPSTPDSDQHCFTGFILTRQQQDQPEGIALTYWIKTATQALPVTVTQQEAVLFVRDEQVDKIHSLLAHLRGWRLAKVELKDLAWRGVHALYAQSLKTYRQIQEILQIHSIAMMEEDIRHTDRFLMERFIQGAVTVESNPQQIKLRAAEFTPKLRILSFDLETTLRADQILSAAFYADDYQHVLMQGQGVSDAEITYVADERQLLKRLIAIVQEYDPDAFIGWNVVGFDFRVLYERAQALKLPLKLGRDEQSIKLHQSAQGKSFVRIAGRVVLDGIDTLKGATYQFESFSLEYVAREMLQRGKIIDHVDDRGGEIQRLFRKDKQALARYNLEDCKLVWDIFSRADLINYLLERARLTGLPLDKVGGSAAAFDNQYLPLLHRQGYVAPEYASGASGLGAPGGYVMDSLPGIYQHVLVLDFKSLYPSIIRTFKIDPCGMAEGLQGQCGEDDLLPGFNHAIFSRKNTLLPGLIEKLWSARDRAKASGNQALSQAIKIIMNSYYGVLGSNLCRFYDQRLSSSITLRGHEILTTTRDCIEQNFGYKVIYGDTDSVFVWLGEDADAATADDSGKALAAFLNRWWQDNLQQRFKLPSHLEIEYETHYCQFLMPTMRHSDKGTKKRYAGLQVLPNNETKMVFKGLENVRTDWTPLARELQEQLYENIFRGRPWKSLISETVNALMLGQLDDKLIYRKRLRQRLDQYQKNRPPHVQAALKAQQYYSAQGQPNPYKAGSQIAYVITVKGAEPLEAVQSALDYQHYMEKQIQPVCETIMQFLNESFEELVAPQQALF